MYQFYTDLDAPNRMDAKPFLILDCNDIDETLLPELRKLTKEHFDLESIITAAEELKYIGEIKRTLSAQFKEPDDEWIRFFTARVYDGSFTKKAREQFAPLVSKAGSQYINDQVNERLKTALGSNFLGSVAQATDTNATDQDKQDNQDQDEKGITTTLEEMEGFQIVKAIACSEVSPQRIFYRDSKSYFAILLDDNNRKPIARLHFNSKSKRYLGILDAEKNETRHPLDSLDAIYLHCEAIRDTVRNYL